MDVVFPGFDPGATIQDVLQSLIRRLDKAESFMQSLGIAVGQALADLASQFFDAIANLAGDLAGALLQGIPIVGPFLAMIGKAGVTTIIRSGIRLPSTSYSGYNY